MPSASKNIYCANASSWPYTLSVNWSVSSQNISGNSTIISASGSLSASNVGWDSNYNSYLKLYWHDNRTNTDTHFATSAGFLSCGRGYGTRSVSGSITVTHNNDGSLSGYVRCEYVAGSTSGGWAPGTNSVSTGFSGLPSIPRASSFGTISGNQIGSNVTVNINRHSSSFTHSLWYAYGNSTWHDIGGGIATSKTFTLPMSVCNSFPNNGSGTIRLMLRTYSGSTIIGSDVITSFTANVPSWVGPDGNISVSRVDNGVPASWGVYVKGYSKATVSVNGWGSYGSTIKSYSLSGGGLNSSASSATTSPLNTAGAVKFGCTITDSRWRTKYIETSIYVENYTKPSVSITAQRCLSDGTVSSSGSYLKCVVNYNYASVAGKNSITSKSLSCNGVSNTSFTNGSEIILPANCDINKSYRVTASVTDGLGNSATVDIAISTDTRVMNVKKNKQGIAFGKFAEMDRVADFGWHIIANEGLWLALDKNTNVLRAGHWWGESDKNHHVDKMIPNTTCFAFPAHGAAGWGNIFSFANEHNSYPAQIQADYGGNHLRYRIRNDDTGYWGQWEVVAKRNESAGTVYKHDYWGLANPDLGDGSFIRTPQGGLLPWKFGGYSNIGSNYWPFNHVFCVHGVTITSDRNQKKDIFDISDPYIQMFKTLRPVSYKLKRKGSDRTHIGFISQEVKESMDKAGLTDMDFGGYCRDVKQEEGENHEWHDILDENGNKQYIYSLRYEEFIALNTKMIQECMKTIEQQQKEIDELKQMINALLQKEGAK